MIVFRATVLFRVDDQATAVSAYERALNGLRRGRAIVLKADLASLDEVEVHLPPSHEHTP